MTSLIDKRLQMRGTFRSPSNDPIEPTVGLFASLTPLKINMEHNHGCLEDHVPFKMCNL